MITPPSQSRINEYVEKLNKGLGDYAGVLMADSSVYAMANGIVDVLFSGSKQDRSKARDAVMTSLKHLSGRKHDSAVIAKNLYRIAANWHLLKKGVSIPEWNGSPVVSRVVVVGLRRLKHERFFMKLKLKSGVAAGVVACTVMSKNMADYFVEHSAGCGRLEASPEDISGMELTAVVKANGSDSVRLTDLTTNEQQKKHNKELVENRSAAGRCTSGCPCNVCPRTIQQCPLAIWLPEIQQ